MNDPKTPEDYLRAYRRILEALEVEWNSLPDGDGEHRNYGFKTKTDWLLIMMGCVISGLDSIKKQNQIKQMVDSL